MCDGVEVVEGDVGIGLGAAFHGDNDGVRAVAEFGQLLARSLLI
jgi:hypothetical protein